MSTFEQLNDFDSTLAQAKEAGHVVVGHYTPLHSEYVILDDDNTAQLLSLTSRPTRSLLGDGLPEFTLSTENGLKVVGITRRAGIFRRFIEGAPESYQTGDKVVLRSNDDTTHKTRRINSFGPRQNDTF